MKRQEKINALYELYEEGYSNSICNCDSVTINAMFPDSVLASDAFFPFRDNAPITKFIYFKFPWPICKFSTHITLPV